MSNSWQTAYPMREEAMRKIAKIQEGWSSPPSAYMDLEAQLTETRERSITELLERQLMASVGISQEALKSIDNNVRGIGYDRFMMEQQQKQKKSRFVGDDSVANPNVVAQVVGLEEYVRDLESFSIVQGIYVLSDERDDDENVSILIKLHPLSLIKPDVLEQDNTHITDYLTNTSIQRCKEVEVSFQYTEVYG